MNHYTATYSPDDNKLRLYSATRLDAETYARVKAAGFTWAPKQGLFVAPMWTPGREDLLLALAGQIGDEDRSLMNRAQERADRFDDYSDKRGREADQAQKAVEAISGRFEFGQPILVGHHSEKRARKDAERMENGMRRAVKLWETSEYWTYRARRALAHAAYKERPDVRHRRIKSLEADKRKQEREQAQAQKELAAWLRCELEADPDKKMAVALVIAAACHLSMPKKEGDRQDWDQRPSAYTALSNSCPSLYAPRTVEEVIERAKKSYPARIEYCARWLAHYENRLAYERVMLGEGGAVAAEKFDIQPGGRVLIGTEWLVVLRVTKRKGRTLSVRTNARFSPVRGIGEVAEYAPPTEEDAAKVKRVTTLAPLVNYPGPDFVHLTKAEFDKLPKDYCGTQKIKPTAEVGTHRVRAALGVFLGKSGKAGYESHSYHNIFIMDAKRVDPPKADPQEPAPVPVSFERQTVAPAPMAEHTQSQSKPEIIHHARAERFAAMRESLEAGVQVVSAPQLFPTPYELAERMAVEADIQPGQLVADFSAGTGRLLKAAQNAQPECRRIGVEINRQLCQELSKSDPGAEVFCSDFLRWNGTKMVDVVLLNPPFAEAQDIVHIQRAWEFVKPQGRMVAICANGPRQNAALKPWVENLGGTWEPLPPGTFAASGTGVNTVLIQIVA